MSIIESGRHFGNGFRTRPAPTQSGTDLALFEKAPLPKYHRILQVVRNRIAVGQYPAGQQMPTENELMAEFGVSRHTIRSAMQALVSDGVIQRSAGRGSFVTDQMTNRQDWTIQTLEDLITDQFDNTNHVLNHGFVEASTYHQAMTQLELNHDDDIFFVRTLRVRNRSAYAFARIFVPGGIGRHLEKADLASRPIIQLLEDVCRLPAFRARQIASARLPDAETSELLGLQPNTPVLELTRTYFTRDGRPIEYAQIHYRTDMYMQRIDLFRRTTPESRTLPGAAWDEPDHGAKRIGE